MFQNYIDEILTSWHALQFAVQQRTGGVQSSAIAKWMNEVTEKFFYDNDDLEPDEVAEFLSTIMNQELNTLVEDGSDLEISETLCQVYRFHKNGNIDQIENILSKLPKNNHLECKVQSESDAEDEVQTSQVFSQISSMNISDNFNQIEDVQMSSTKPPEQSTSDADGWVMVQKGKKKNR